MNASVHNRKMGNNVDLRSYYYTLETIQMKSSVTSPPTVVRSDFIRQLGSLGLGYGFGPGFLFQSLSAETHLILLWTIE